MYKRKIFSKVENRIFVLCSWTYLLKISASPQSVKEEISSKNINLRSFKSSEHINEKGGGPYHGFDY